MTSARKYPRTARVNEVMLEVLADELERLSDPRLELVTFTGVDVSRDLAHAKVYYSTLTATAVDHGASVEADVAERAAFGRFAPPGRGRAARCASARCRRLDFVVDPGIVSGQRIEDILRDIHHREASGDDDGRVDDDGATGGEEDS